MFQQPALDLEAPRKPTEARVLADDAMTRDKEPASILCTGSRSGAHSRWSTCCCGKIAVRQRCSAGYPAQGIPTCTKEWRSDLGNVDVVDCPHISCEIGRRCAACAAHWSALERCWFDRRPRSDCYWISRPSARDNRVALVRDDGEWTNWRIERLCAHVYLLKMWRTASMRTTRCPSLAVFGHACSPEP